MLWTDFQRPRRLEIDTDTLTQSYGRFVAQPFERGFATTVGNALRRCLLSSIEGAAITAVRIEGVLHEFSSVPGVKEDVTDIVLNLKQIPVRLLAEGPRVLAIDIKGPHEVRARDLAGDPQIEIVDPDALIATVNEEGRLRMEVQIKQGRGYAATEKNLDESLGLGWIPLDSVHSPVRRVNYRVETARVGRMTDYEKLTLEVWTNGTVAPQEAVSLAATLLKEHLAIFVDRRGGPAPGGRRRGRRNRARVASSPRTSTSSTSRCAPRTASRTRRSAPCGIWCRARRSEILEIKNFGKKSLEELQELLGRLGLSFGMDVNERRAPERRRRI